MVMWGLSNQSIEGACVAPSTGKAGWSLPLNARFARWIDLRGACIAPSKGKAFGASPSRLHCSPGRYPQASLLVSMKW